MDLEDFKMGSIVFLTCFGLPLMLLGAIGTGIACFSDDIIGKNELKDYLRDINIKNTELNNLIEEKSGCEEFVSSNFKLIHGNDNNILSVFGTKNDTNNKGQSIKEFVEISFEIDEENANCIKEKIVDKDNCNSYTYDIISKLGTSSAINTEKEYNTFSREALKKSYELSKEVYDSLNNAIKKAFSCVYRKISEENSMLHSTYEAYKTANTEAFTIPRLDEFGQATGRFQKPSILTTDISIVSRDEEKNCSYFYIDIVIKTPTRFEGYKYLQNRVKIQVEGTNMNDQEVYNSFINGNYKKFEILQDQNDEYSTISAYISNTSTSSFKELENE